jgi:hypothetical protein
VSHGYRTPEEALKSSELVEATEESFSFATSNHSQTSATSGERDGSLKSFSALDHGFEFLLQEAHGFLAIEEDSGRTESAVRKWTIGPCKKYGDLGTAHRTGGCPNLPQGRLHHYRLGFIVVFGIFAALAREASDPIALICYARFHRSSVLEIDL